MDHAAQEGPQGARRRQGRLRLPGPLNRFDVLILGAGGAGMMCAIEAGRRGRRVALFDHAAKVGGKIVISGGGRCNFTNTGAGPGNFVSENPPFCRSALSRFPPERFIAMVREHGIAFHEKKLGQLFCDESASRIVDLLVKECQAAGARFFAGHKIASVAKAEGGFVVETDHGAFHGTSLVVATGGLSLPKLGATGLGYEVARQFGLKVTETAPALDGFVFADGERRAFAGLEGLSLEAELTCGGVSFREGLLFTHAGLSGPAALQASLHWHPGDAVRVDFLPDQPRDAQLRTVSGLLPRRLADRVTELWLPAGVAPANLSKKDLETFIAKLKGWTFVPAGTVGYGRAEVTRGGVDTTELSSKTMEARKVPGLYFVGEVVDVTGWLGGFNFQWAWSSGWAAGQAV